MILGITGGSGSGKSSLLALIQEQGGMALDCDAIYHDLLRNDAAMIGQIATHFPTAVKGGIVDRKQLGSIVFQDATALGQLNQITHSAVKQTVISQLASKPGLAAIDAFALFESGLAELCQLTVAVTAPVEDRVARLVQRDNITREYALSRIHAQKSDAEFSRLCSYTLHNNGDLQEFRSKCLAFLQEIGII